MLIAKAPDFTITFVTEWPEATLGQFIKLHRSMIEDDAGNTTFTMRSALEAFASDPALVGDLEAGDELKILKEMGFINKIPDFRKEPLPDTVAGIKPPLELGTCTLLQKWCVEQQMEYFQDEDQPVNFITMAIPLLSIYLYPMLTGKKLTDLSEIDQIKEQIESLPCVSALSLSAFFLTNWRTSTSSGKTNFQLSSPKAPAKRSLSQWFRNLRHTISTRFSRRSLRSVV